MIPFIAGGLLAVTVAAFAKATRFELDRGFYPTVLIIIPSYYVLFAILGGSSRALLWETVVAVAFSVVAVSGALRFPFLVGGGIAATASLTSSTISSFRTPGSRPGGRASVSELMCYWDSG